jgi:hypothetical protein
VTGTEATGALGATTFAARRTRGARRFSEDAATGAAATAAGTGTVDALCGTTVGNLREAADVAVGVGGGGPIAYADLHAMWYSSVPSACSSNQKANLRPARHLRGNGWPGLADIHAVASSGNDTVPSI